LAAQAASATETAVAARATVAAISTGAAGRCGIRPIASTTACAADATGTARAALPPKTAIASEAACTTCNRSAVGEGVVKIGDPTSDARATRSPLFTIAAGTTCYAITTRAASRAIISGRAIDAIRARCASRTHSAISSRSASRSNDPIATGEVAGVRIRRAAAIGGSGQIGGQECGKDDRGNERNGGAGGIFHGMVGWCLKWAVVEIFHGGEVKEGVCPSVCRVGFLENVFHITQNYVPAKTPKNHSGPSSARHQKKRKIGAKSR
jgi:hypothetical protein